MRYTIIITSVLFLLNPLLAQKSSESLKLLVSSRVDTNNNDVKDVIKLYENYYNSSPDSIYDNPYWNEKEKELYKDFDFSRVSIFQGNMDAEKLFQYYPPFVMSVERIGEKYQIRVLFSSPTTDPKYSGSKVWCIQKLNAVKQNQDWVLENLIIELSNSWLHQKVGYIHYIYPPHHKFNFDSANHAKEFCDGLIKRFNPEYNDSFDYYITNSVDDMGLLENFDYYFVGITTGKAREGMLFTAKGNEFYPHEFVHKLLPPNQNRGYLIEEGLATYLGTKQDPKEYEALMQKLATDLHVKSEKINFKSVISQTIRFSGYQTAYPAGAGICELIYEIKGDDGLNKLLKADTKTYQEIINIVSSITKLTEKEIEKEWLRIINKYYR